MGDKVMVRPDELSDWMYVEKGKLVGGYTVRVLYHEATPEEREEYHRQLRCTIPPVDF